MRTILLTRVGVATAMLVVVARPSSGTQPAAWDIAVFTGYLVWTIATSAPGRRTVNLAARRPALLWIEQAICMGLVLAGGGARVISLYACALPIILATVMDSPRLGLALATVDAIVVATVLGGATLLGTRAGTEPVHATEWPPGLVGLYIAVALFAYVRRLLLALEETGVAFEARSREVVAAAGAEARTQTRLVDLADVAARIGDVTPNICRHVERLRNHRPGDSVWQTECDQLERLAAHAQTGLAELSAIAPPPFSAAATVADAIAAAVAHVGSLGAVGVRIDTATCTHALAGDAAAALRRFVEEAVWNAHKHGRPPITVTVSTTHGQARVTIADHGAGFDSKIAHRRVGIRSLYRDAELLGGHARIAAQPGRPVTVHLAFPVGEHA